MVHEESGVAAAPREGNCLVIAGWHLHENRHLLERDGDSVKLEPKTTQLLAYLARRAGEPLSRRKLLDEVWPGVIVSDEALSNAINKIRRAFNDDRQNPAVIETIPKMGYRLIAPVSYEPAGADAGQPEAAPIPPETTSSGHTDGEPRRTPFSRRTLWLGAALLFAVALAVGVIWQVQGPEPQVARQGAPGAGEPGRAPSIVVLPFENLGDNLQQQAFADGITEDIITDLSSLSDMLVIASNTAFTFKGRQVTAQEVAGELNVDFVLEGSIRRHGDSVRVNAQLVDARTGFQKWARRYDRPLNEVFAVQDEVTSSIVEALLVKLSPEEQERLSTRPTNNLAAYDEFLEGQRLARMNTRESNVQAQAAFRRAIALDRGYGRAYGALAHSLAFGFRRGWTDAPMQSIDRALELARKAVELDDSIPQTFWALGYVHLMRKEHDEAEKAASIAITIAPNYADGYGLLALIRNNLGESESAIDLIKKGMKLNPYYTWDYPYNLGRAYYMLGRIDEAITALEAAKQRNENAVPVRLHLAASYVRAGRQDDAEWEVEEVQVISPTETLSHMRDAHPLKDQELLLMLVEDLRKAGLPE